MTRVSFGPSRRAPLRLLRRPVFVRALSTLVAVGVALTLAPTAVASGRVDAVRAVLDDVRAFEAALEAAHSSDDPVAAFARAYSDATEGAVSSEAIVRLIGSTSMSGVAPVPTDEARARASIEGPSGSPSPATHHTSSRTIGATTTVAASPAADLEAGRVSASPSQPRGP